MWKRKGLHRRIGISGDQEWWYGNNRIDVDWSGGGGPERRYSARVRGVACMVSGRTESDVLEALVQKIESGGDWLIARMKERENNDSMSRY